MQERNFEIRPVVAGQFHRLVEIYNSARRSAGCYPAGEVTLEYFTEQTAGEEILVASLGAQIAGFVSVWVADRFLHHLYVAPEWQGRGMGRALIDACQTRFGLPLSLKCDCCNTRARQFYLRNGWVVTEQGTGEFGLWERLRLG